MTLVVAEGGEAATWVLGDLSKGGVFLEDGRMPKQPSFDEWLLMSEKEQKKVVSKFSHSARKKFFDKKMATLVPAESADVLFEDPIV